MIKNIKQRWLSQTPKFWKLIRNAAAVIGAVSTAILTAETAAGIDLSSSYKKLLAWGIAIGAGVAAFSQLQKTNKND